MFTPQDRVSRLRKFHSLRRNVRWSNLRPFNHPKTLFRTALSRGMAIAVLNLCRFRWRIDAGEEMKNPRPSSLPSTVLRHHGRSRRRGSLGLTTDLAGLSIAPDVDAMWPAGPRQHRSQKSPVAPCAGRPSAMAGYPVPCIGGIGVQPLFQCMRGQPQSRLAVISSASRSRSGRA